MAKTCERADHVDPWMDCPWCRATSHYGFKLNGWFPGKAGKDITHDDLPPYDEVRDQKREAGLEAPDE